MQSTAEKLTNSLRMKQGKIDLKDQICKTVSNNKVLMIIHKNLIAAIDNKNPFYTVNKNVIKHNLKDLF